MKQNKRYTEEIRRDVLPLKLWYMPNQPIYGKVHTTNDSGHTEHDR